MIHLFFCFLCHFPRKQTSNRIKYLGIIILVGIVLCYLEYKKIDKAKTNAIIKSLEDLKELE